MEDTHVSRYNYNNKVLEKYWYTYFTGKNYILENKSYSDYFFQNNITLKQIGNYLSLLKYVFLLITVLKYLRLL